MEVKPNKAKRRQIRRESEWRALKGLLEAATRMADGRTNGPTFRFFCPYCHSSKRSLTVFFPGRCACRACKVRPDLRDFFSKLGLPFGLPPAVMGLPDQSGQSEAKPCVISREIMGEGHSVPLKRLRRPGGPERLIG
jgi:hypothetical protein